MFLQSLLMTRRDWRAGELRFLLAALVIAVAALSSVGFFADRVRAGLNRDANKLLGADLVISADHPVNRAWREEALRRGLRIADTVTFPSMALAGTDDSALSQLASVKAVSEGYPLRGALKLAVPDGGATIDASGIPQAGTVWVDAGLLSALNIPVGGRLGLGDSSFTVAKVIAMEADRGVSFMNFAPRVMLRMEDLAATNLIQAGSRVNYRLLVAGEAAQMASFQKWVRGAMARDNARGVRIESLELGRPEMRATLNRAEQFLSLVSLLSAMLAAVAIAMAARRFMLRHVDACAMLRCLGLTQNQVTVLYLYEFLFVGLIGSLLGVLAGFATHFALTEWLGKLVGAELPSPTLTPALHGIATGLLLLLGFAIAPVLQLRNVPHNRVIRREQDPPRPMTLAAYVLGATGFVILLLWRARDVKLALLTAGGFLGGVAVFALAAWGALRVLRMLRELTQQPSWRFAVTALQRRSGAAVVQTVALALGLMALLLLTVTRGDLIAAWRASTPPDAPNRFVINIQPEQKADIEARLAAAGIARPVLYPMIRGRLVEVNRTRITASTYSEERARRLVDREFNLSTMSELPGHNRISAGRWFDGGGAQASVEAGLARTLNLKLGDTMRFDIAGQSVEATITSLRELDWSSMRVNFFVILSPGSVASMPATWITAFHLPASHAGLVHLLTRDFPNLTVIDVGSMLRQIQEVVDHVVAAVEFLFLFTLASGLLVLYAALVGSQEERMREASLLRALGATRSQLARAQWIEFSLLGGLAGILAATGAAAVGATLARFVFNFEWSFTPAVWVAGLLAGAVCALAGGALALREVVNNPPLKSLREA